MVKFSAPLLSLAAIGFATLSEAVPAPRTWKKIAVQAHRGGLGMQLDPNLHLFSPPQKKKNSHLSLSVISSIPIASSYKEGEVERDGRNVAKWNEYMVSRLSLTRVLCWRRKIGLRPESTAFAFAYALEIGSDVLEMDLVFTKDGIVMPTSPISLDYPPMLYLENTPLTSPPPRD